MFLVQRNSDNKLFAMKKSPPNTGDLERDRVMGESRLLSSIDSDDVMKAEAVY